MWDKSYIVVYNSREKGDYVMNKLLLLVSILLVVTALAVACASEETAPTSTPAVSPAAIEAGYVGSEKCGQCHADEYSSFQVSGHPWKLKTAEVAKDNPLPLPEGYTWDDISYVVGGYKWKARYLDEDGYIITTTGGEPGKNQYNMMVGTWSDYHPGEEKKYDCGKCHTTGYSSEGNQGDLEGIVGT